jgi:hypothetical protein
LLIDMQAYFDAAMDAMSPARHCVHLLNWAFEANTLFHPEAGCTGPDSDRIGNCLATPANKPEIGVRVLCWKSAMPVAATQHFFSVPGSQGVRGHQGEVRLGRQAASWRLSPSRDDRDRRRPGLLRRR